MCDTTNNNNATGNQHQHQNQHQNQRKKKKKKKKEKEKRKKEKHVQSRRSPSHVAYVSQVPVLPSAIHHLGVRNHRQTGKEQTQQQQQRRTPSLPSEWHPGYEAKQGSTGGREGGGQSRNKAGSGKETKVKTRPGRGSLGRGGAKQASPKCPFNQMSFSFPSLAKESSL